jgi:hypothetical protein
VRRRVESCHQGGSGKVRVGVHESGGKLSLDAETGPSLDPMDKPCVLEALSTVHEASTRNLSYGPSVPPTGFTSQVAIEW